MNKAVPIKNPRSEKKNCWQMKSLSFTNQTRCTRFKMRRRNKKIEKEFLKTRVPELFETEDKIALTYNVRYRVLSDRHFLQKKNEDILHKS